MAEKRITQIPFPGNSGETPTGAMQFDQDWPGLFVRGDDASFLLIEIRQVEQLLKEKCKGSLPCELQRIARIIEQDVIVHNQDAPRPD